MMEKRKQFPPDTLKEEVARFYFRYKNEMEQVSNQLNLCLQQLALVYTVENKLSKEAVFISTRIKSQESFLRKLLRRGCRSLQPSANIITDLIGGKITCWFLKDCYGMLDKINASNWIQTRKDSLEDYIINPKKSGYRSIHILAGIPEHDMVCEIQIRTRLQDFWGELTHEFHYTGKEFGDNQMLYEKLVSEMANRFASEDHSIFELRNLYQTVFNQNELPERKDKSE